MSKIDEIKTINAPSEPPPTTEVVTETPPLDTMKRADTLTLFGDSKAQFEKLKVTAETLVITDASQVSEMKIARETRLALRKVRVAIEHRRVELVEGLKKQTGAIDKQARELRQSIEPLEARLQDQEDFAIRQEAERKETLKNERAEALRPLGADPSFYSLGEMPEAQWVELLKGAQDAHTARVEAARKADEARIAQEKAEAEERERVRLENQRLREEAIERERLAAIERNNARKEQERVEAEARAEKKRLEDQIEAERKRAKELAEMEKRKAEQVAHKLKVESEEAENERRQNRIKEQEEARREHDKLFAKAQQELQARQKVEAELAEKKHQEEDAERVRVWAEQKAAQAPDKEKLMALAATIREVATPTCSTDKGRVLMDEIAAKVEAFAVWIEKKAGTL